MQSPLWALVGALCRLWAQIVYHGRQWAHLYGRVWARMGALLWAHSYAVGAPMGALQFRMGALLWAHFYRHITLLRCSAVLSAFAVASDLLADLLTARFSGLTSQFGVEFALLLLMPYSVPCQPRREPFRVYRIRAIRGDLAGGLRLACVLCGQKPSTASAVVSLGWGLLHILARVAL